MLPADHCAAIVVDLSVYLWTLLWHLFGIDQSELAPEDPKRMQFFKLNFILAFQDQRKNDST